MDARLTQKSPVPNLFCSRILRFCSTSNDVQGVILSGQLAAKEDTKYLNVSIPDQQKQPRKVTERPADPKAADANQKTPDRTLYQVRMTSNDQVPKEVLWELPETTKQLV